MKKTLFTSCTDVRGATKLAQWPCKISLVPKNAPYFDGANLLIAADCCAYAYGNIHNDFMKNSITLIACPRAEADFSEKIKAIILGNSINSIRLLKMEVGCCTTLETEIERVVKESGKSIDFEVVTISTEGKILNNK